MALKLQDPIKKNERRARKIGKSKISNNPVTKTIEQKHSQFMKIKTQQHLSKWSQAKQDDPMELTHMEENERVHKELIRGARGPRRNKLKGKEARLAREDRRAEMGPRHGVRGGR